MPGRVLQCFGIAVLLVFGSAAHAQNLVVNGDFTSDLASWNVEAAGPGATGSSTFDADSGSAAVGGARLLLSDDVGTFGVVQGLNQCIATPGLAPWDFGARRRVVTDTDVGGGPNSFILVVHFYSSGDCTGTNSSEIVSIGTPVNGILDGMVVADFEQLASTQLTDPLPGGNPTNSVRVALRVQADALGDQIDAVFDSVYFGPDDTTPVELQEFRID